MPLPEMHTSVVDLTLQAIVTKSNIPPKLLADKCKVGIDTMYRYLRLQKPLPAALISPIYQLTGRREIVRAALLQTDLATFKLLSPERLDPMLLVADIQENLAQLLKLVVKNSQGTTLSALEQVEVNQAVGDAIGALMQIQKDLLPKVDVHQ